MQRSSETNLTTKKKYYKPKRGRKSPNRLTIWEQKFSKKLRRHHGTFAKKTFHRLMKKSSTLRSTLKRRSKEYEVKFDISLEEVRELLYRVYGRTCNYCHQKLLVNNMACDHIIPLSMGGDSTPENLQMICGRCNTRKGPLMDRDFRKLLKWLDRQNIDLKKYVLRKLSSRDF
jgi:5-methylcytosine-specific restriction endonuclease McrA